jgi:hypothetical protein
MIRRMKMEMEMEMKKYISLLATSLVLVLATGTVSAIPIDGNIAYAGASTTTYSGTEVASINFGTAVVTTATGDYAAEGVIPFSSAVNLVNLHPVTAPVAGLWVIEGFTFDLASITSNFVSGLSATVTGNGAVKHAGYDDTFVTWGFTTQRHSGETSFSASVPAPAGAALLGLGLLGFGFARRNKKAS